MLVDKTVRLLVGTLMLRCYLVKVPHHDLSFVPFLGWAVDEELQYIIELLQC